MKKILFAAYSLDIGGIEISLITLINELAKNNYDITLVLEKKRGILLEKIDQKIKIIEYCPSNNKIKVFSKLKNLFKRIYFLLNYKDKYDFACSYATYSLPCSFVARISSRHNALWVHSDYLQMNNNNIKKYKNFFKTIHVKKFKKIFFVSEKMKNDFKIIFQNKKNSIYVINNLCDYSRIIEMSDYPVYDIKKEKIYTFLNVSRHTEEDKRISRLIEAASLLKNEGKRFRVLMVGNGKDSENYKKMVKDKNLDKFFIFLGEKSNPYPYFKLADAVVLTSEYEGFPVVYIESMILNKPILTTDVSDSKTIIKDKYGLVVAKNVKSIKNGLEMFIEGKFEKGESFNPEIYNKKIMEKINNIINE